MAWAGRTLQSQRSAPRPGGVISCRPALRGRGNCVGLLRQLVNQQRGARGHTTPGFVRRQRFYPPVDSDDIEDGAQEPSEASLVAPGLGDGDLLPVRGIQRPEEWVLAELVEETVVEQAFTARDLIDQQ
jgi:hypothetical protein